MLHCIEPDSATCDRIANAGGDIVGLEHLHQPQHLHALALALLPHPGFQKPLQGGELLRQLPIGERCGLVDRIGLLLNQRQVVQRIGHEVLARVGTRMARDNLSATGDDDLVHIPSDQNLLVAVGRRHRVVVVPVANQRQRTDPTRPLLTGIVGGWQRLVEGRQIVCEPLPDRAVISAQPVRQPLAATLQKMRIQRLEVGEHRDRHHEVPSRVADEPFDLAFIVALAWTAEHARALAFAVVQDARHSDLCVVIEDRLRNAVEELEGSDMAVAKRFRRLGWVAHHEYRVGVR